MTSNQETLGIRYSIENTALSELHANAFNSPFRLIPWKERLERHSVSWVGAFDGHQLVGFVHEVWDGGAHAFLLDTVVSPDHQRRGIGAAVVSALAKDIADRGCQWLHVDYEPHLAPFYRDACGFNHTEAGLLNLQG